MNSTKKLMIGMMVVYMYTVSFVVPGYGDFEGMTTNLFLRSSDDKRKTDIYKSPIVSNAAPVRIYLEILNNGDNDKNIFANFVLGGDLFIKSNVPVYIPKHSRDMMWVDSLLGNMGNYTVGVIFSNNADSGKASGSMTRSLKLISDIDTDGDDYYDLEDSDDDNDSILDTQEGLLGTNPKNKDTDGDGVNDAIDVFPKDSYETLDTDKDGIGDNADTDDDNDGILDTQEGILGTSPKNPDTDSDGIADGQESKNGTNPKNPDTDGDSLNDGQEIKNKTNPKNPDTDSDGLSDGQEIKKGTDPKNPDTDSDGIADAKDPLTNQRVKINTVFPKIVFSSLVYRYSIGDSYDKDGKIQKTQWRIDNDIYTGNTIIYKPFNNWLPFKKSKNVLEIYDDKGEKSEQSFTVFIIQPRLLMCWGALFIIGISSFLFFIVRRRRKKKKNTSNM